MINATINDQSVQNQASGEPMGVDVTPKAVEQTPSTPVNSAVPTPPPTDIPPNFNETPRKPKKKKKFDVKMIAGVFALLLIVVGASAGFFLSQQNQDLRQQASTDDDAYGRECTIDYHCAGFGENARCENGFCASDSTAHNCTAAEGGEWDPDRYICIYPGGTKVDPSLYKGGPCERPSDCLVTEYCPDIGANAGRCTPKEPECSDIDPINPCKFSSEKCVSNICISTDVSLCDNTDDCSDYTNGSTGSSYSCVDNICRKDGSQCGSQFCTSQEECIVDSGEKKCVPKNNCPEANLCSTNGESCRVEGYDQSTAYYTCVSGCCTAPDSKSGYLHICEGQSYEDAIKGCNDPDAKFIEDWKQWTKDHPNFAPKCGAWQFDYDDDGGYEGDHSDDCGGGGGGGGGGGTSYSCNSTCTSNDQCSDLGLFCDTETSNRCRLQTNPTSEACEPPVTTTDPICKDIAILDTDDNILDPLTTNFSIGMSLKFRCASEDPNSLVTNYEFKITEPNGTIVDGTTINPADSSTISKVYEINQYLDHEVQCRVCEASGCQDWINIIN